MRYAHTNIAAQDWKKVAEFYVKEISRVNG